MKEEDNFYPRNANQTFKAWKTDQTQTLNIKTSTKLIFKPNKRLQTQGQQQAQAQTSQASEQPPSQTKLFCEPQKVKSYFKAWLLFTIAFVTFLLIWVIAHFSIQRLTDSYYFNPYNLSPSSSLQLWKVYLSNALADTYLLSNAFYTSDELKKPDSVALALVFSWTMWKLPLTIFTFISIPTKASSLQKYSTFGFFIVLLLLIDIMTTAFKPQNYQDWIFFLIYTLLSLTLIVANGLKQKNKLLKNLKNFLLPILYITFAYVSFSILIPGIYHAIYNNLGSDSPYVIAHLFPAFDLIFYSLIIIMTYFCRPRTLKLIKMFHFLNIGYLVGHIVLFSPQDVEFYFILTYLAVRNLSFNWVHAKVQKYVIVPCPQPAWLMIYLFSLSINFIPFVGFGKLVISRSFYSQILQLTVPILSYALPSQYFAHPPQAVPQNYTFNPSLKSNISISTIFIVWVISTITQKYHISKIELKQLFFYLFGIYMFYFGLSTGIQLEFLQANSL